MSFHHSSPVSSLPHRPSPWASGNGEFFHTHLQFFLTTLLSRLARFFHRISHAIQGPPPLSIQPRDLRSRFQPLSRRPRPRPSRPPSADRLRSRLSDFAMQSHPTPPPPRIFLNHSSTIGCSLNLPSAIDPLPSDLPTAPTPAPRILVLDDEEAICRLITYALSPHGYEVTEALDGMTAIAHYKHALATGRPFDLVISDLTLPEGLSGAETMIQLRAIRIHRSHHEAIPARRSRHQSRQRHQFYRQTRQTRKYGKLRLLSRFLPKCLPNLLLRWRQFCRKHDP